MTHNNNKVAFGLGFICHLKCIHSLSQLASQRDSPFDGFSIPKRKLNKFMIFRMKIALFKSLLVFAYFWLFLFCFFFISFEEIRAHLYAWLKCTYLSMFANYDARMSVIQSLNAIGFISTFIQNMLLIRCFNVSMFQSSNVVSCGWLFLLLLLSSSSSLS